MLYMYFLKRQVSKLLDHAEEQNTLFIAKS